MIRNKRKNKFPPFLSILKMFVINLFISLFHFLSEYFIYICFHPFYVAQRKRSIIRFVLLSFYEFFRIAKENTKIGTKIVSEKH